MPKKVYKRFHSQRRFGVEIEVGSEVSKAKVARAIKKVSDRPVRVSGYSTSNDNCFWHVKADSSCGSQGPGGPGGVEIASYIGSGSEDINTISSMGKTLLDAGCIVNRHCGLHIHAEVLEMDDFDVGVMLAWWIKMEQVLSCAFPLDRTFGRHSRLTYPLGDIDVVSVRGRKVSRDAYYGPFGLLEIFGPKDLSMFDNDDRRRNLNIVNVIRAIEEGSTFRKTVELRWPEGTLCPEAIRSLIRFFLGFIDSVKRFRYPANLHPLSVEEVLACCGLSVGRNVVLSHSLMECRRWLLRRITQAIENGVDRMIRLSVLSKIMADARKLLEKNQP